MEKNNHETQISLFAPHPPFNLTPPLKKTTDSDRNGVSGNDKIKRREKKKKKDEPTWKKVVLVKRNCYHSHRDPTCPPLTNAIASLSTMNARVFPEARKSRRSGSSRKEGGSIPLTDGCAVFTRGGVSLGMYEWSTLA